MKNTNSWTSSALDLPLIIRNISSRVLKSLERSRRTSNLMTLVWTPNSTSLDLQLNRSESVIPYPLTIKKMTMIMRLNTISQRSQSFNPTCYQP